MLTNLCYWCSPYDFNDLTFLTSTNELHYVLPQDGCGSQFFFKTCTIEMIFSPCSNYVDDVADPSMSWLPFQQLPPNFVTYVPLPHRHPLNSSAQECNFRDLLSYKTKNHIDFMSFHSAHQYGSTKRLLENNSYIDSITTTP